MKISQLLELDCRKKENEAILKMKLYKIEPLAKKANSESEIDLIYLEKFLWLMQNKYDCHVHTLSMSRGEERGEYYACNVSSFQKGMQLTSLPVYGCTLYELWAKMCIYLWGMIQQERVRKRG